MDKRQVNQDEFEHVTPDGYISDDTLSIPDDHSPAEDPFLKYADNPPTLIAVMGVTGSGKTTFVNQASRSSLKVGEDLRSCTTDIQESEEFILDGRRVIIIDTPGFNDTRKSDTDVLKSIAAFLGESYSAGAKLAGVIYVHRISDDRFEGSAVKNFRMFRELCGEKTLKNVILVTSMWGQVTPQKGAQREEQLKDDFFRAAIEMGAQMCRHHNTPKSAREILRKILKNQPAVLKIQRELIDEHKDIGETGAGAELNREIREAVERYQKDIRELEEDMRRAMEEKDEVYQEVLEKERVRMEEKMEKVQKDSAEMNTKLDEARREMEERISARVEEQLKLAQEKHEAEIRKYEEKMKELSEQDRHGNASKIESMRREMEELRAKANEWRPCTIM